MAEWGKGDPRWIVEEREDATNVNNWHWTERDATKWSKDKLNSMLTNIKVEDERGQCEIYEVKEITGEASASNRKAKLIFFYEWDIKLEWKGTLTGSEAEWNGTIQIPNLSDENDVDEVDIEISPKLSTPESSKLREVMKSKGTPVLKEKLQEYIKSLKEEFSKGMILPSKSQTNSPVNAVATKKGGAAGAAKKQENGMSTNQMQNLNLGVKLETSKLELTEMFKCESALLYTVFTEVDRLQAFTRARATLQLEAGGKFTMMDDNISGEFVSLEPHSKIVMKWRFKSWTAGHYSLVTLKFTQKSDGTELTLTQKGIPSSDLDRTRHGWKAIFFDRIKGTFGMGATLF